MLKIAFPLLVVVFTLNSDWNSARAQSDPKLPRGLGTELRSFISLYQHPDRGQIWLEIPARDRPDGFCFEFLYVPGLSAGLGSNPVGLDRGKLGREQIIGVYRIGGRAYFRVPNLRYRARSSDSAESRAVRESFASSVVWSGPIKPHPRRVDAVEISSFLLADRFGVAETLEQTGQGTYSIDSNLSTLLCEESLAFPRNLELDTWLTLKTKTPAEAEEVGRTAALADVFTLKQHHSFVQLPDRDYRPRRYRPACGSFRILFDDYTQPLTESTRVEWVTRHRLNRSGLPRKLVYYVDRGVPEPVRSALIEGAAWWAEAFAKAGFPETFRVELLPPDAHPLDVRFNVIQWVHRQTRGWSYGASVIDPRTGEIIKGHVSLGSRRVRQDLKLFESIFGKSAQRPRTPVEPDPVELSLARIRQLSAHEVGHTLGLAHNFAASTYSNRASVMDYPAPLLGVDDRGRIEASRAYAVGVGAWDVQAIRYLYSEYESEEAEAAGLEAILRENRERGYEYLSDADARPIGSAQPRAHLWDNGADAISELERVLKVRRVALENFSPKILGPTEPQSLLGERFALVYLYHRYQVEAAIKLIGGREYAYGTAANPTVVRRVAESAQRTALRAILKTIEPDFLSVPETVASLLSPVEPGQGASRERLEGRGGMIFDPLALAESAADFVLSRLLNSERLHRLEPPMLEFLLSTLSQKLVTKSLEAAPLEPIPTLISQRYLDHLFRIASDSGHSSRIRARIVEELRSLDQSLRQLSPEGDWNARELSRRIRLYLDGRLKINELDTPLPLPPGSPIGCDGL